MQYIIFTTPDGNISQGGTNIHLSQVGIQVVGLPFLGLKFGIWGIFWG